MSWKRRKQSVQLQIVTTTVLFWFICLIKEIWTCGLTPPALRPPGDLLWVRGHCPCSWRCVTECVYLSKVAGSRWPSALRLPDCCNLVGHGNRSPQFTRRERLCVWGEEKEEERVGKERRGLWQFGVKHKCVSKCVFMCERADGSSSNLE